MMAMIEQHRINEAHKQMLIEHLSSTSRYGDTLFWLSCWALLSGWCCPCVADTFRSNGFEDHDIETLASLTHELLKEMRITMLAHRKKILAEAAKLK